MLVVLARLRAKNQLAPRAAAGGVDAASPACFDLTGLPPTPKEIESFMKDTRPRRVRGVVERTCWHRRRLRSAGRRQLVDGFATPHGRIEKRSCATRQNRWQYRDYVIRSFKREQPFNQFSGAGGGDGGRLWRMTPSRHRHRACHRGRWGDDGNPRCGFPINSNTLAERPPRTRPGRRPRIECWLRRCHDH